MINLVNILGEPKLRPGITVDSEEGFRLSTDALELHLEQSRMGFWFKVESGSYCEDLFKITIGQVRRQGLADSDLARTSYGIFTWPEIASTSKDDIRFFYTKIDRLVDSIKNPVSHIPTSPLISKAVDHIKQAQQQRKKNGEIFIGNQMVSYVSQIKGITKPTYKPLMKDPSYCKVCGSNWGCMHPRVKD